MPPPGQCEYLNRHSRFFLKFQGRVESQRWGSWADNVETARQAELQEP